MRENTTRPCSLMNRSTIVVRCPGAASADRTAEYRPAAHRLAAQVRHLLFVLLNERPIRPWLAR
jgi:hypothetical protein